MSQIKNPGRTKDPGRIRKPGAEPRILKPGETIERGEANYDVTVIDQPEVRSRNLRKAVARGAVFGAVGAAAGLPFRSEESPVMPIAIGATVGAVFGATVGALIVDGMWTRNRGFLGRLFQNTIYPAFGAANPGGPITARKPQSELRPLPTRGQIPLPRG